jgi:DeoR/GlpR family transcriptional regulator of sugar metabolism
MIVQDSRIIMLAGYSKLGASSRVQYRLTEQMDTLVTGAGVSKNTLDVFSCCKIKNIILA